MWLGGYAGGMPQYLGLGAAQEESAFGLVKVEHCSQLAAGFDTAVRIICLISNGKGYEDVIQLYCLFWMGQWGCPCLLALREAGEDGNSLIRERSEAEKCWECVS